MNKDGPDLLTMHSVPLADRFGRSLVPALHLWWRLAWRLLVLPILVVMVIMIVALVSEEAARGSHEFGFAGAVVGMGLFWLFFIPLMVVYSIWLIRETVFVKPFLHQNIPHAFVVRYRAEMLPLPLSIESAVALWWGMTWRAWAGAVISMVVLFFLGPLHIFLQIGVGYFAILWLLAAPLGSTRITVTSLGPT